MPSIDLSALKKFNPHITKDDPNPRVSSSDVYQYKDIQLDLEFGTLRGNLHAEQQLDTSDLADLRDAADIKQSINNIFNTVPGQKLLNPYLGLNLAGYLFEPVNRQTADAIARTILTGLPGQDPRVKITSLKVMGSVDNTNYDITIAIKYPGSIDEILYAGILSPDGFKFNT